MAPTLLPDGVPVQKRLFDLLLTVPGLLLLSPLIGLLALVVLLTQGRPVFFRQARGGYRGKVFHIYKFRTMREAFDGQGNLLPDEKRMTRIGRLMRSASLDELPELINIVAGEMSLVGPRPLMARYLERYSSEQRRRHEVLPGLTGWAQINGRNALTWEERFRLDVWYVEHWSLGLDIKILTRTFLKVLRRDGISEPGQATMTEFMGSKE
jgi:lipopolysaccharide/colanic/teichoic acid biosynthesis glycosyltransferase